MGGDPLAVGQPEGQCRGERASDVDVVRDHHSRAAEASSPRPTRGQLQEKQLLEGDALGCPRPAVLIIREMDLVLGRFADTDLTSLNDAELGELEAWLDIPDQQMFAWVNGAEPTPAELETALFRRLREFHNEGAA